MAAEHISINLRELDAILANNKLNEYLSTFDMEDLLLVKRQVLCDDLSESRLRILSLVEDTIECRLLEKFVSLKDAEFISDEFDLNLNSDNYDEIRRSFEVLEQIGDFQDLIKWCPSLLFIDRAYRVFAYLKELGKTDDEIISLLCSSFDRTMKLSSSIDKSSKRPEFEDQFLDLLNGIAKRVEYNKATTESYRMYTNKMFAENADLLKRLS